MTQSVPPKLGRIVITEGQHCIAPHEVPSNAGSLWLAKNNTAKNRPQTAALYITGSTFSFHPNSDSLIFQQDTRLGSLDKLVQHCTHVQVLVALDGTGHNMEYSMQRRKHNRVSIKPVAVQRNILERSTAPTVLCCCWYSLFCRTGQYETLGRIQKIDTALQTVLCPK